MQDEFNYIVRMPIKHAGREGCAEMLYSKRGLWIVVDFFKREHSYEACVNLCNFHGMSAESCPCNRFFKNKTNYGK
jgi:hypothetical protein